MRWLVALSVGGLPHRYKRSATTSTWTTQLDECTALGGYLVVPDAQIETDSGRLTIALTQDLSATGLLVLSHQAIGIGLFDGNQYAVTGTVVRAEPLAREESVMWRSKEAVAVDPRQPDLAQILVAID